MKSDEEISTADSAQIESLIERVKQGKLEQNDAQLIERLLRAFLTLITLLQRKNTTIKRLKQLFVSFRWCGSPKAHGAPSICTGGDAMQHTLTRRPLSRCISLSSFSQAITSYRTRSACGSGGGEIR
jgi:hypothetical protein